METSKPKKKTGGSKKTGLTKSVKKGGKLTDKNMATLTKMAKKVNIPTSIKGQKRNKRSLILALRMDKS